MSVLPSSSVGACWLAAFSWFAGLVGAQEPIAERLRARIAQDGIPGLSCAAVVGEEMVFAAGFGLADLENDVPATERTVYRLASISKPVTAVLAMQLVEQGVLDLDADVHTLVAAWPEKRWPVTTRQLLGHLGGVRHYQGEGESTRHYANQIAGLARFAKDPLLHAPGSRFRYSSYGFNLVAAVLEARTGRPFPALVRERIAVPAHAPTLQDDDQRRLIKWRAQGYRRVDGELVNSRLMDSSYKLGGGGLCASAPDLARFARALMAFELVGKDSLTAMWTGQHTRDGRPTNYGLGFAVRTVDGEQVVSHSGAQARVSTMLVMLPAHRIAVVVMCNLEGVKLAAMTRRIALSLREEVR
ncbi:MAG TPA: class A beta-lactamase-related serine hydrolase [bacterium]|nr:class A beta-lactamase-related serine hydrolase [bacterium]